MKRRDLLLGFGCVAAIATAEAIRPRRRVSLVGTRKLEDMVPTAFAGWSAEGGGSIVVPKVPGSLADTLYSQTVTRTYQAADGGAPVMLLIAYGDAQSDLLQLHRPEICYRAVGFAVESLVSTILPLTGGVALPAVEMVARAGSRTEDVLYWTRLGEYLPRSQGEQRSDRLRTAFAGEIADGILVRVSAVRGDGQPDWTRLRRFATAMMAAVAPADRAGLIGTQAAMALART